MHTNSYIHCQTRASALLNLHQCDHVNTTACTERWGHAGVTPVLSVNRVVLGGEMSKR